METGPILSSSGSLLGTVEKIGSAYYLYSDCGKLMGHYDESTNYTYDSSARILGIGNMLGVLIK